MNDEAHIDENLRAAESALPGSLTAEERSIIDDARDEYRRLMKIGCTGCGYCMPCPAHVDIPGCFAEYNTHHLFPHDRTSRFQYVGRHGGLMGQTSYAGLCQNCGKCVKVCPQHLPIPVLMKEVSHEMDGLVIPVVVPILKGGLWCINTFGKMKRAIMGEKADA
jgi:predicted aldo/keto reductase-like oxidoreductase